MNLNLLPLCYEREFSDLVFFFKALFGNTDLDVNTFVSFSNPKIPPSPLKPLSVNPTHSKHSTSTN
jgi:hypothetical protein